MTCGFEIPIPSSIAWSLQNQNLTKMVYTANSFFHQKSTKNDMKFWALSISHGDWQELHWLWTMSLSVQIQYPKSVVNYLKLLQVSKMVIYYGIYQSVACTKKSFATLPVRLYDSTHLNLWICLHYFPMKYNCHQSIWPMFNAEKSPLSRVLRSLVLDNLVKVVGI